MRGALRVTVIVGVLLVCGCSAGEEQESAYAADIRALESSSVALVRQVAADGKLEESEFREVQQSYLDCMGDHGIPTRVTVDEYGVESYETNAELSGLPEGAMQACEAGTNNSVVTNLYWETVRNPDRVDFNELIVQCLQQFTVVDQSYTAEQLVEDAQRQVVPGGDGGSPDLLRCETDPRAAMAEN